MPDRQAIANSAADSIEAASSADSPMGALVGFDGFIDSIVHMVDRRTDMSPSGYTRLRTIGDFAARCAGAAGQSTNIEQVLIEDRFGGNGPLMAGALAGLGARVTFVGAVGAVNAEETIHPVFREFASLCDGVFPVAPPSHTLCAEFEDGKLMFNETSNVQRVTWDRVVGVVGLQRLRQAVQGASLVGIVNWSLLGGVEGIWRGLMRDVFADLPSSRRVFIDLSDPAKRSDADLRRGLGLLRDMNAMSGVRVTLGLNLAEAQRLMALHGLEAGAAAGASAWAVRAAAELRRELGLDCVAVHPREGAAAALATGEAAWYDGPFTRNPRLSTGAGDHFNAGFAFAQVLGLPLEECLAVGVAASGAYVRDARSPSSARLAEFLRRLPEPESRSR